MLENSPLLRDENEEKLIAQCVDNATFFLVFKKNIVAIMIIRKRIFSRIVLLETMSTRIAIIS